MRFLIDAQLPPALARFLESVGHQAVHVADLGARHAKDSWIWDLALKEDRVLITKDEDFAQRSTLAKSSPALIWIRFGNTSRRELLRRIEPMVGVWVSRIEEGEHLLEVR